MTCYCLHDSLQGAHVHGPTVLRHVLSMLLAMSSCVQSILYAHGEVSLVQHFAAACRLRGNCAYLTIFIALLLALAFDLAFALTMAFYAKPSRRSYLLNALARCSRSCCMIMRAMV